MTERDSNLANEALKDITGKMAKTARIADRKPSDIALIAVSKTRSGEEIRPLLEVGHRVFGENRVQEAADKWPALKAAFEGWLDPANFDGDGQQRRSLGTFIDAARAA